MGYRVEEKWLSEYDQDKHRDLLESYFDDYKKYLLSLSKGQQRKECVSGYNRMKRVKYWSCDALNISVEVGDICFIEYGQVFINEAGYQHFGLVVSQFNHKLLVVPMTSNDEAVRQARNVIDEGKEHLYYIGKVEGLNKPSVLFLNDCKFINSCRIISVNGHISPRSRMFKEICHCLKEGISSGAVVK